MAGLSISSHSHVPPGAFATSKSDESLDVLDYLQRNKDTTLNDSLIATSLSGLSLCDSIHSFEHHPPFDLISASRPARDVPLMTSTILMISDPAPSVDSQAAITIPTVPRLKTMLTEPISVDRWTDRIVFQPPPHHSPWKDDASASETPVSPPWIPEGSILPPEAFSAILRQRRRISPNGSVRKQSLSPIEDQFPDVSIQAVADEFSLRDSPSILLPHPTTGSPMLLPAINGQLTTLSTSSSLAVPTIMVSDSIAAVPMSFESSQSLRSNVPLAVRRGQKPPAPLSITSTMSPSTGSDMYPGIPSSFLGAYTPTFEFSGVPVSPSMDLNAMCSVLRSRCPPLHPPTPQEAVALKLSDQSQDLDAHQICSDSRSEDDWAFIEAYIAEFADDSFVLTGVPIKDIGDSSDSYNWETAPTLTNGSDYSPTDPNGNSSRRAVPADSVKQQRRRTVIIETPDDGVRRHARVTLDMSGLSEDGHQGSSEQEPVPFESPDRSSLSLDGAAQSTPQRPMSSAMQPAPTKGILKEKKSVRFSVLPSMHEYSSEGAQPEPAAFPKRVSKPGRISSNGLSAEDHCAQGGSPPRQKCVSTMDSSTNRVSFPKHPAIRSSFVHKAHGDPDAPRPPSLAARDRPPTAFKRAPLRPVNGRQSMPVSNISSALGRRPQSSITKEDVGAPKKLRPVTATMSMPPRLKEHSFNRDENGMGRDPKDKKRRDFAIATVPSRSHKSRMPVPFRSILTKFRAA
ncbi:hypothetical protein K474DRAFT_1770866 [Panus rudis PR-1116 ss-1]|nr:hypothetical protein K474DRAFT_1770866 [Panus rudis PR-1116 ss-1]